MNSLKSWAGIEEWKAGRSVCCVMQSVRVLVICVVGLSCIRRELGNRFEHFQSLDITKFSYVCPR